MAGRTKAIEGTSRPVRIKEEIQPVKGWICTCCGKSYSAQHGNFNPTNSILYKANRGYTTVCKECTDELFEHYAATFGSERKAIERMCMHWDIYYSDNVVDAVVRKGGAGVGVFQKFLRNIALNPHRGKTYDDHISEKPKEVIESPEQAAQNNGKVTKKMVEFWGAGFPEEDYIELDRSYKDWVSRHECKTGAQERLFKSLAMSDIVLKRAFLTGDTKKVKDAMDAQQSLMGSANIKPNQKNESIGNELVYGQWIQKLEETRPVSEPDPAWKDVDGIGHYVRVWVLGGILNMFKLKNPFKAEYDEEISKYTAHKPEYHEDEVSSDEIRDAVFGIENAEV